MATMSEIVHRCKSVLASHYGPRFRGLVLYGSVARRQASATSDIDLLILLGPPVDYFHELRCIIELLYPIQLESEQLISAKPAVLDEFKQGVIQLYRDAQREGVVV